ncbi:hypothetical protein [Roseateles sp.]|uniref:hypothetical protein n=1 Tax=Roseateles sp. TaxID=1971397 RepID=UPI0037CC1CE2
MNKMSLYGVTAMTPIERQTGRFMRAPDHAADAGNVTQPGGGNNGSQGGEGNSGGTVSGDSNSNNTGESFDPAAFWNGPASAEGAASSGESAGNGSGESDTNGGGNANQTGFATQLTERLSGLTFGDPIFNAEVAEQINEGNFTGVQERFNAMGQQIVREALAMQVQILRPFAEQLMEQVRQETKQTFTSRDNKESLVTLFPAAKNPVMAQTIQPIYDQALRNANGDRAKAVAQTKEMLRFMAGESAADLNIEIAPRGQGDRGGPTPNFNWLDDLTGRN